MAKSDVLLLEPIAGLGAEGDQVSVRAGFARNFLLPRKKAMSVSHANKKQIEKLPQVRAEREAKELQGAQDLATKLKSTTIVFAVKTGERGKMFGAITSAQVHERLAEEGFDLDKKKVGLELPVKTLGKQVAHIKLHPEVTIDFEFEVVSENPIEKEDQ